MLVEHKSPAAAGSTGRSSSLSRVLQLHHACRADAASMLNDMHWFALHLQRSCTSRAACAAANLQQLCMQCRADAGLPVTAWASKPGAALHPFILGMQPRSCSRPAAGSRAGCVARPALHIASCVPIAFPHKSSKSHSLSTSLQRVRPRRCLRARLCNAPVCSLRLHVRLEPIHAALRSGVLPASESPLAAARAPPLLPLCRLQQ